MREYIEERAVEIANYIIENNATVRQTATCGWMQPRTGIITRGIMNTIKKCS